MPVHGEVIVDEAISFIATHLTLATPTLEYPLSEQIDFNLLQLLHRKELSEICRWDIKYMEQLRDYMKISYKALLDVYEEMKQLLLEERQFHVEYARKQMIRIAQAYYQKYKPTFEEFRSNALLTYAYAMLTITALIDIGDDITLETFKWATNDTKIIKASSIICRFMDDLAEHNKEDDCSAIEYYMEEYCVSAEETYAEFNKQIQEFLKPTEMLASVLSRSLNLPRVIDELYKDADGYTHLGKVTKNGITSMLINPVPL
ncbi:hypothetical protein DITRI_Ditri01bG0166200 [Diplodiscus trichospermus]